ncbi:hypothetical protein SAMN05720766_12536 [Fibrobacter sp. UWH9]|nr:hypothetical protein SAMN05720766_12536 [Fibrobacter sp. UWH9]
MQPYLKKHPLAEYFFIIPNHGTIAQKGYFHPQLL